MGAVDYLLQRRASRERDPFARNMMLLGGLAWLLLTAMAMKANDSVDPGIPLGVGLVILGILTLTLAISIPLRQIQKDSQLHASLHGGRCYQEILGSLLTPTEMVDQIAWHSAHTYLRASAPWTALLTALWAVGVPAHGLQTMLIGVLWWPLSTLFVWSSSYLAQQFCIYNSQLKEGFVRSVGDSLVGLVVGVPTGLALLATWVCLINGRLGLALFFGLLYLLFTRGLSRAVASAGIERLPHLRQRLQTISRFWLGRRNRFVWAWSENPIVVRERRREAGRIPGQWLGALLFQLPLASLTALVLLNLPAGPPDDYPVLCSFVMVTLGALQILRASHRCSQAIVAEVEHQTLESMQNTRLHAREYLSGWLQIGALPLVLENLLIALMLATAGPLPPANFLIHSLVFCLAPVVGASLGLAASYASNRQAAARRYSEFLCLAAFGLGVASVASCFLPTELIPSWPALLLIYGVTTFTLALRHLLSNIEISQTAS